MDFKSFLPPQRNAITSPARCLMCPEWVPANDDKIVHIISWHGGQPRTLALHIACARRLSVVLCEQADLHE